MNKAYLIKLLLIVAAIDLAGVKQTGAFDVSTCERTQPPLTTYEECMCRAYGEFNWKGVAALAVIGAIGGGLTSKRWQGALGGALVCSAPYFMKQRDDLWQKWRNCHE
jgi:hypothetical protein